MKMTFKRLTDSILDGKGAGIGDQYSPWIQITKRNTSKQSSQSVVPMPGLVRLSHFLSRGERDMANVLWWIGAMDVREQFPLWPWQHPHPHKEVNSEAVLPDMPGMIEIARDAGIPIYNYPGLRIPTVLTVDFLVTLPHDVGETARFLGVSCKHQSVFEGASAIERERERLELDRRYCLVAESEHLLVHPENLPVELVRQLDWLSPLQSNEIISRIVASREYKIFLDRLERKAYQMPAYRAAEEAHVGLGWSKGFAEFAMRMAMWRLDIDADLLNPISMTSPLRLGGRALRAALRRRIFGANA